MSDWLSVLAAPFAFEHVFMWRALATCCLLGVSASILGCVLVVRRLSLLGDALAHSLLPGIGLAYLLFGTSIMALLIGGLVAGVLTAMASALISRLTRLKEDAAFAALFITLVAAGVMLISRIGTPIDLMHFLFGNVLGLSDADLDLAAGVSVLTVVAVAFGYRAILLECFDPAFHRASGGWSTLTHLGLLALIVLNLVAALHALGSVLAIGLFMLPAVTANLWCERWGRMLTVAALVAVVGSTLGLYLSYQAHLASGPCMVATLGLGFLLSCLISPRHGLLRRLRRPPTHYREDTNQPCALPVTGDIRAPGP
jgi:zinc/manganese transport system permease protein